MGVAVAEGGEGIVEEHEEEVHDADPKAATEGDITAQDAPFETEDLRFDLLCHLREVFTRCGEVEATGALLKELGGEAFL